MTVDAPRALDQHAEDRLPAELRRARAQVAALEQLLEVHERTSIEQALRLEQTNRELDQFAYVASHDLKAPLRGIASLAHWIEEDLADRMTEESHEHMRLLKGRVQRMEALIDGILAYSRAGRVRETLVEVDVGFLISECIELLSPQVPVRFDVAGQMPVLWTERVSLQQVFLNLIGNAVKHGAGRDLVITIGARETAAWVEFFVGDNGPGIEPQFQEKIWQIFQTLAPRDKVEGAGIGLSVVRKLVETRGGRAWVDSEAGRGTTFYFTWPATTRTSE